MPRYFFAVVPPEPVLNQIESFRGRWGHAHHNVEPHITLKVPFEWDTDPEGFLKAVRPALAQVAPFQATLGQPARFADAGVLYLSIPGSEVPSLHRALYGALGGLVPVDPRGHEGERFTAHLTLAVERFGIERTALDAMEEAARAELAALPAWTVASIRCYRRERLGDRWQPYCDLPLGS